VKQLRIIWAALVVGTLLYTVLVVAVTLSGIAPIGTLDPALLNYAGAAVMVYLVVGVVIRRRMIANIDRDAPPDQRLAAYSTATILGAGLTEGGGMLLVTLALMAGSATWALTGGLTAVLVMVIGRPAEEDIGLD
jgi:uncharacterized protein YycO